MPRFFFPALFFVWTLSCSMSGVVGADDQYIPRAVIEAMEAYLNSDCAVGNNSGNLQIIVTFRSLLEPRLIQVLKLTPNSPELEKHKKRLEKEWVTYSAFLNKNPGLGLSPQGLSKVANQSKEQYVSRQLKRMVQKRRFNAAIALNAINSPLAQAELKKALETEDLVFRNFLRVALKRDVSRQSRN